MDKDGNVDIYLKLLGDLGLDETVLIEDGSAENKTVQKMKNFRQHYETTCFDHCYTVSYYCYLICKKYKLDYISAARAGMLHDLFLYDWRIRQPDRKGLHALY